MKKAAEALAAAQARVIEPEAENAALVAESREVYGRLEGVSAKLLELREVRAKLHAAPTDEAQTRYE